MEETLKIDKSHSVHWTDKNFIFLVLKLEDKDAFAVGIIEPKNRERRSLALFTGDEFSSLLSEIVKYCFDLPKVARSIPCPIDLTKVPHGLLKTRRAKCRKKGDDVVIDIKWDPRLLEYHGVEPNEWELYDPKSEYVALAMRPIRSKALKERRITEFRIVGRNQAIKIQTRKNPALKVEMTMKKSMLDTIDKALDIGLHMNRQEFIADAIRAKLNKLEIKHDIP